MLSQSIRRKFLEYFKNRGHAVIPSSSVIPHDDPTLLFINAGMNQFKDVFLGQSHRDYNSATTSQKCIRVGGKHNDLENVGHTARHLTFFEMLGNFSFGDYFKKEAIQYAWEVSTEVFGFNPEKIWPTVFLDDDEAFELWTKYVPAERITRFGEKENFWMMGDIGPCGPCSELLFDRGPKYGTAQNPLQDTGGHRFLEYWNLVFMQYNRQLNGQIQPLPHPSIDTGSGLERILSLKMDVESVYETDVLRSLIAKIEDLSGIPYLLTEERSSAFRVIADHLRCLSFAIADGAQPSNLDRGYVLRKVLRRAVRYGRQLGFEKPFLSQVFPSLVNAMGEDYPELIASRGRIEEILTLEEEAFIRTLRRGGNILQQVIDESMSKNLRISGEDIFKLKDTYGLPYEEIELIAKDAHLSLDEERYQQLEQEAKIRSRQNQKVLHQSVEENIYSDFLKEAGNSCFVGFTHAIVDTSIVGLVTNGKFASELKEGEKGIIFLKETPFYAEMGGQVGDLGTLQTAHHFFEVTSCVQPYKGLIAHEGVMQSGHFSVGDTVTASIDRERRQKIANHHTATHLLHWALHCLLGEHIKQAGSVVDADRLRFDFNHHKPLTSEELQNIENLVNEKIRENKAVTTYEASFEDIQRDSEIKQFFGEKYGSKVRVVDIEYSKELCGGTHANQVGNLGFFKIIKEGSIAAGIRRIEAVVGEAAEVFVRSFEDSLHRISQILKVPLSQIDQKLLKILEENKQLVNELKELKNQHLNQVVETALKSEEEVTGKKVLFITTSLTQAEVKPFFDLLCEKSTAGVIVLGVELAERCQLLVKVSEIYVKEGVSAKKILDFLLGIVEGTGGGKNQMAQGGGKLACKLPEALNALRKKGITSF